ncbi:MAG: DM13 domain-containing protein, partial [Gemmatimonadaceae bacterium]
PLFSRSPLGTRWCDSAYVQDLTRRDVMSRRRIIFAGAVLVAGIGWWVFRPETAFIDNRVDEPLEVPGNAAAAETSAAAGVTAAPTVLARGTFHSNAHETRGTATIFRFADGRRVLRLTSFQTSNGPDVHVYLVAAPDVNDDATVETAGFVALGSLKGNLGDQNYDIPPDVDLSRFRAVSIWCKRFSVNFGAAPLSGTG